MKWSDTLQERQALAATVRECYHRIWDSCETDYRKVEWSTFSAVLVAASERFAFDRWVSLEEYVATTVRYMGAKDAEELITRNSAAKILARQIAMFGNLYRKTPFTDSSLEVKLITDYLAMVARGPENRPPR